MEYADGIHEYAGRADVGGDPVDEAPRRMRVSGVGNLAHDAVRKFVQPVLVPVNRHDGQTAGGEIDRGSAPSEPPPPATIATLARIG